MDDVEVAQSLINWDPSIRYLATLARKRKREKPPNQEYNKQDDFKDWFRKWKKRNKNQIVSPSQ